MAGPPVIEGSLKNTIHALAFGLICATLAVNFGKYFVPHFFPYMVGIIIVVEAVLFALDKPKENYEKFRAQGIKGTHTIEGSPQITVSGPPHDDLESTPTKMGKIKEKLKKGRRESGVPGSPRHSLVPPQSPGQEAMDGKETGKDKAKEKSDKERKKEEEKEKKREKEEEKERQKAEKKEEKEKGTDGEEEKGSWRKRRAKASKQNTV